MSLSKNLKKQILNIKAIAKITNAMQKVAVNKMRRAQEHMETSMPYSDKIRDVVAHINSCATEYHSPYLKQRDPIKQACYIIIATDHGLCGGLNANLLKKTLEHIQIIKQQNADISLCLFGEKAKRFFTSFDFEIIANITNLGDHPKLSELVGSIKIALDNYKLAKADRLFIAHNKFVNTMSQKPIITQLLPIQKPENVRSIYKHNWDYIYETESKSVLIDTLIVRYVESQVYQAVVSNVACEQVARMVAMKTATDNAKDLIEDLSMMYNKARQAMITQELSEIVAGADAI